MGRDYTPMELDVHSIYNHNHYVQFSVHNFILIINYATVLAIQNYNT